MSPSQIGQASRNGHPPDHRDLRAPMGRGPSSSPKLKQHWFWGKASRDRAPAPPPRPSAAGAGSRPARMADRYSRARPAGDRRSRESVATGNRDQAPGDASGNHEAPWPSPLGHGPRPWRFSSWFRGCKLLFKSRVPSSGRRTVLSILQHEGVTSGGRRYGRAACINAP